MKPGTIVQVTREGHDWFACLVQVSEPKSFGCQGFVKIPLGGEAHIRLRKDDYEVVGEAVLVPAPDAGDDSNA